MAVQKSSNAVCFQDERKKEDPLSTEVQRQCESKMIPTELPMFSTDFAAQNLYTALAWHKSPHWPTSLFHEISLPTPLFSFLKTNTLVVSFQARNMTMRVRRPLQGTLRKKIRSHATQSKKVKKTRTPNCFFRSCARKKLNQSRKRSQCMRRNQRRRQNPKRR